MTQKKMNRHFPNEREQRAYDSIKHYLMPDLLRYVADLQDLYHMALRKCAYLDQTDNARYRTIEEFDELFRGELEFAQQAEELQALEDRD